MFNEAILFKFKTSYDIKKSNNGKYIANLDSKVNIWDAHNMKLIYSFKDIKNPSSIAFSNSSKYLAVKNTSGKVSLYDLKTMENVKTIQISQKEGTKLLFTADDKYILSADWDGNIYLFNILTNEIILIKEYPGCMVEDIEYDEVSFKYIFLISQKRTDKYTSTTANDYNILLEWKYPFDLNDITERKVDCTIWKLRYNNIYDSYVTINKDKLVVYNNKFEIIRTMHIQELGIVLGLDWSIDGKYILFLCGSKVEIIAYDNFSVIKSFDLEYARFIEFVSIDNDKRVFCGTLSKGYYIDFLELISLRG